MLFFANFVILYSWLVTQRSLSSMLVVEMVDGCDIFQWTGNATAWVSKRIRNDFKLQEKMQDCTHPCADWHAIEFFFVFYLLQCDGLLVDFVCDDIFQFQYPKCASVFIVYLSREGNEKLLPVLKQCAADNAIVVSIGVRLPYCVIWRCHLDLW